MKKKLLTVLLATALTAALFGCGGSKAEKSAPAAAPAETEAEEAPAEEEEAPAEEEEAPAEEEEAPAEEETADEGSSDGSFSLLDVDESMIDVGVYGNDSNGGELVFSMFTGPDNNKYVALMGFNNDSNSGDVICGQYEATTETDEDGLDWTYFDVTDVYTGDNYQLGVGENAETNQIVFFDASGAVVEGKYLDSAETINYMGSAAALLMNNDQ